MKLKMARLIDDERKSYVAAVKGPPPRPIVVDKSNMPSKGKSSNDKQVAEASEASDDQEGKEEGEKKHKKEK